MNNVKTYKDQSVFDIAIQEYGSIEGVFDLLKNNPGLEFDSDIESGTALNTSGTIIDQYDPPANASYGGAGIEFDGNGELWVVRQNTYMVYQVEFSDLLGPRGAGASPDLGQRDG